jgi:hypothetical protein
MVKYNIVMRRYDKILVNVDAYVILQRIIYSIIEYNKNTINIIKIYHCRENDELYRLILMDIPWLGVFIIQGYS